VASEYAEERELLADLDDPLTGTASRWDAVCDPEIPRISGTGPWGAGMSCGLSEGASPRIGAAAIATAAGRIV